MPVPLWFAIIALFCCISCTQQPEIALNKGTVNKPCTLAAYLKEIQTAEAGQAMPYCFQQAFCRDAFGYLDHFNYLDTAVCYCGQLLYQDSQIVVLNFYYDANWADNSAKAAIIASYQFPQGLLIDASLQFANAVFDYRDSLGYQLGISHRSSQVATDNKDTIIVQTSTTKQFKRLSKEARFESPIKVDKWRTSIDKRGVFTRRKMQ